MRLYVGLGELPLYKLGGIGQVCTLKVWSKLGLLKYLVKVYNTVIIVAEIYIVAHHS